MTNYPRMHVSLYVKNIEESKKFYKMFFNQEPTKIREDYMKFELEQPGLIISFVQNSERVQSNFGHLGIQVGTKEEMEAKLSFIKSKQIEVLEERGTACCYAIQDKFWATDPDGHQWEVYYFHEDVEFNDPKYANETASACCTPEPQVKKKIVMSELSSNQCEPGSGCC